MLLKKKFRELKTADEEKALSEKSFSKSTDMSQIGLSIVAQWQDARLNKQAANEEAGFHVEREKNPKPRYKHYHDARVVEFCG